MTRLILSTMALCAAIGLSVVGSAQTPASDNTFQFTYEVTLESVTPGEGPIDVFVPIAQSGPHQDVIDYTITATIPGSEGVEGTYKNRFWHGHLDRSNGQAIRVKVVYLARRKSFDKDVSGATRDHYTDAEKRAHQVYLTANRRVPISGAIVDPIAREIAPNETSLAAIARATYDYVIDNMSYKKIGTGWGNGDTFWACSQKHGNCTDFHALFNSLARARGIPARFEIGFPIPTDDKSGMIKGYHCWVQFFLPDIGWVPIDASEAKKHPEKRSLLFGSQPADRFKFTVGRDLELGPGHTTGPLNYFIYAHIEVGGTQFDNAEHTFSFSPRKADAQN